MLQLNADDGHPQSKIPPLLWGLILIFNSDGFVAADLQIRPSCATILSDVQPPIIVLKKLPVTDGNLAQSIKRLMLFPDSPALFLFWRASAALRFIHVSQNEKFASHLSTFLSGNSM